MLHKMFWRQTSLTCVAAQIRHRETETRCCASDQHSSSNTQKDIKAGMIYKILLELSQKLTLQGQVLKTYG